MELFRQPWFHVIESSTYRNKRGIWGIPPRLVLNWLVLVLGAVCVWWSLCFYILLYVSILFLPSLARLLRFVQRGAWQPGHWWASASSRVGACACCCCLFTVFIVALPVCVTPTLWQSVGFGESNNWTKHHQPFCFPFVKSQIKVFKNVIEMKITGEKGIRQSITTTYFMINITTD